MKILSNKILIFFLIFARNIDCGYTLEPPRRGGSNEYPQTRLWTKNKKNIVKYMDWPSRLLYVYTFPDVQEEYDKGPLTL